MNVLIIDDKYDALGRRMQKSVKDLISTDLNKTYTRNFVYNDENILFEFDGNNSLLTRHTHNPLTLDDVLSTQYSNSAVNSGIVQTSGNYYYHKDHLGSVIAISDSSGNVKQKYNYSSFGKILSITDGNNADISVSPFIRSIFTYTGRELEEETSLYYYRARFYDADIGRFLQQDPEPGKLNAPSSVINKYIYVGNAPLMFADPSGKFLQFLLFAFISAAVMTFYQSITGQVKGNQNIQETFLKNFAFAIVFGMFSQYAMGTNFIRVFNDMTFKEVAGIAINYGTKQAFNSGLISIFSHATGAPVMEMILIFGYMYFPDMTPEQKKSFFSPPDESFFERN